MTFLQVIWMPIDFRGGIELLVFLGFSFVLIRQNRLIKRLQEGEDKHLLPQDHTQQGTSSHDIPEEIPGSPWLAKVCAIALAKMSDPTFSLETWSAAMGISSRQFQRRLKQESGLTVTQLLQEMRMQEAKRLLESGHSQSVRHLAEMVGMRDAKYFSREYKKKFDKPPTNQQNNP